MPPSLTPDPIADSVRRRAVLAKLPRIHRLDGTAIRVLLVDDEDTLTNLVSLALSYEGWVVDVAHNGQDALRAYRDNRPDVIILDIMLPDTDGLSVLRNLRANGSSTPTLFLTARDSVDDRIVGLTAGGDDYMTKPFSLEELVARLRGLLRRTVQAVSEEKAALVVGNLVMDESSYQVRRGGDDVMLTTTEFDLLRYFMRNPLRVLSRAQILDEVWNYDFAGKASIVDLYVSYLRKKIDADRPPMLHTVRGVGYMLRPAE